MLEIIKIIAEFIIQNISLRDLCKDAHKKRKLAIGAELFYLYTQLNEIYTLGNLIVLEIESDGERLERYKRENRKNDYCLGHNLKFMVDQQHINILRVARSLRRLGTEIQILDSQVYAYLVPLLYSKASIISRILCFDYPNGMYIPSLTYCNPDKVKIILSKSSETYKKFKSKEDNYYNFISDSWDFNLLYSSNKTTQNLFKFIDDNIEIKAIKLDKNGNIRVKELDNIKEYLNKRKPRKQLESLKLCLEKMKDSLTQNFEITDILVKIGEAKGADSSSYLW